MPESPAASASKNASAPSPSEVTTPRPVTATLTPTRGSLASDEREPHRVADAGDRLQLAVGDLDVEAVLERGHELDELERVDVEVAPLGLHRRLGGAGDLELLELLAHAGEDGLFGDFCHQVLLCGWE